MGRKQISEACTTYPSPLLGGLHPLAVGRGFNPVIRWLALISVSYDIPEIQPVKTYFCLINAHRYLVVLLDGDIGGLYPFISGDILRTMRDLQTAPAAIRSVENAATTVVPTSTASADLPVDASLFFNAIMNTVIVLDYYRV